MPHFYQQFYWQLYVNFAPIMPDYASTMPSVTMPQTLSFAQNFIFSPNYAPNFASIMFRQVILIMFW